MHVTTTTRAKLQPLMMLLAPKQAKLSKRGKARFIALEVSQFIILILEWPVNFSVIGLLSGIINEKA
jgi:hypothetical protein